jgi:hypothetical protein
MHWVSESSGRGVAKVSYRASRLMAREYKFSAVSFIYSQAHSPYASAPTQAAVRDVWKHISRGAHFPKHDWPRDSVGGRSGDSPPALIVYNLELG